MNYAGQYDNSTTQICSHRADVCRNNEHLLRKGVGYVLDSKTYELISEGIADMHCMSDEYLVDELKAEFNIPL